MSGRSLTAGLDCTGHFFPREWSDLHASLRSSSPWYSSPLVERTVAKWHNRSAAQACDAAHEVVLGAVTVPELRGFCALGYGVALYAHFLAGGPQASLDGAVHCASNGGSWWAWSLLAESRWGELLHPWQIMEAYRPWRRGLAEEEDDAPRRAGEEWPGPWPRPPDDGVGDRYSAAYLPQFRAAMGGLFPEFELSRCSSQVSSPVASAPRSPQWSVAAFGVHAPTLLEPLHAWHRLRPQGLHTEVAFYGTSHPRMEILLPEACPESDPELRCWLSPHPPVDYWRWVDDRPKLRDSIDSLSATLAADSYFAGVDLIICGGGHSPTLCLLLRAVTDAPLYFTLQAPLAFRMPEGSEIRTSLVALFRAMVAPGARTVASTSLFFLQRQIWAQFGRLLPVVTNHNLYLPTVPRPREADEVLFWQNHVSLMAECSVALFRIIKNLCPDDYPLRLVYKNMARLPGYRPWRRVYAVSAEDSHMTYTAMASRFAAVVLFPHDVGMISFDDVYRLAMPVFMPSNAMIATMAFAHLTSTKNYPWYLLREDLVFLEWHTVEHRAPPWALGGPPLPGGDADLGDERSLYLGRDLRRVEKLSKLVATANFALFPHVQRFSSLSGLLVALRESDFAAISAGMRAFSVQGWQETAEFYRRAARHLSLAAFAESPIPSSCADSTAG